MTSPLSAVHTRDGDTLMITCSGSAEGAAVGALGEALARVHEDAINEAARAVVADLRGLEFASSSALKQFVTWLKRVQALDQQSRYKVVFRSNPHHSWQRRSLGALASFAGDVVEVTSEGS